MILGCITSVIRFVVIIPSNLFILFYCKGQLMLRKIYTARAVSFLSPSVKLPTVHLVKPMSVFASQISFNWVV